MHVTAGFPWRMEESTGQVGRKGVNVVRTSRTSPQFAGQCKDCVYVCANSTQILLISNDKLQPHLIKSGQVIHVCWWQDVHFGAMCCQSTSKAHNSHTMAYKKMMEKSSEHTSSTRF